MIQQEMTAAVLHGKEDLRLQRVALPSAGAGEVVVRVGAALTCGTDLKVYRRGYHASMLKPPILFGHELAGTITAVGPAVTRFAVGDRVVPLNSAPCDQCFFCHKGQQNLCENLLFNNGAYAEFIRIPSRIVDKNMLLLPDSLSFAHAALTEPLACVMRGIEESGVRAGDSTIVIGAGPIGLMFMDAARIVGAEVIAVVKREDQVATAKLCGAHHVVRVQQGQSDHEIVEAVRALTPGCRGADVVIEAVALPATWQWAVEMVRKGGVVNFFGGPPSGTVVALDTNRLHYGDLTLKASFHHTPSSARAAFELIANQGFHSATYLSEERPLSDVVSVFEEMVSRSGLHATRAIKTVIQPQKEMPA